MDDRQYGAGQMLAHLRSRDEPFVLRRNGAAPEWSDEAAHRAAYQQNPELYALLALAESVQDAERDRVLFQLLRASRRGFSKQVRRTLDRVVNILLAILHPDRVLTVFLALRRVRANHKHTSRAILKYILNHPHSEDMAIARRPAIVDCLEHAMGKNVARACAKMLGNPAVADETYLRSNLLKYARDAEWVKEIVSVLYKQETRQTSNGQYQLVHAKYLKQLYDRPERPKTITATNRGDISATLVHLYRGGTSAELQQALEPYVAEAAGNLPRFSGRLALILDASASTRGYGEREYCCIAQSVALQRVLEKCCAELRVFPVGGSGELPMPEGHTDLAGALLDALESEPDLVAIVSDGYENVYPGDLARVIATLPQIGINAPVIFCHSKFTNQDDLSLRRSADNLPQLEFWHQDDFEELLMLLFSAAKDGAGEAGIREFLLEKLDRFEKILSSPSN